MAGLAEAETVSIETRPAGSGSESRHLACEHHQTLVGTQELVAYRDSRPESSHWNPESEIAVTRNVANSPP